MTTAVAADTVTKFKAIENIIKNAGIGPWAYADHAGLRLWHAYHLPEVRAKFTQDQRERMQTWEATGVAEWAKS
eukprot:4806190-Lingulodinium_polyedra.AAC.1